MSSAELMNPPVRRLPARVAVARSLPTRAEAPPARGPYPVAPVTARRAAVRPGARLARYDGVAGLRPVRGGCLPVVGGSAGAGPAAFPGESAPPPLRLTRRGRRLVVALSIATGLVVAGVTAVTVLDGPDSHLQLAGQSSVVVEPGDTLWSIARALAPQEDVRAVVDALTEANRLEGTVLIPGQVLRVP
jgi:nucleoid-associated protein YgaU